MNDDNNRQRPREDRAAREKIQRSSHEGAKPSRRSENNQKTSEKSARYNFESDDNTGGEKSNSKNGKNSKNSKKKNKKKKKKNNVFVTIFKGIIILILVIAFAVGGAGLGTVMGILNDTQALNIEDVTPENYTSLIYDSTGVEIDKLHGDENREYLVFSRIPDHVVKATVAIEDERFFEHNGIDVRGIGRAFVENLRTKSIAQGASTLTQQLIKNEVLTSEQTIIRKIQEMYMAINLENSLEKQLGSKEAAKNYVLELYLNTLSLSHGLHGIEAATQYYFGKHADELTLAEGAALVGITKNPSLYAPDTNPTANKERQTLVLNKMLELNYITQYEYNEAIAEDIYGNIISEVYVAGETQKSTHSYFIEAMIDQIAVDLMEQKSFSRTQAYNLIYSGGLKIHSTVDLDIQAILEKEFLDDSNFPESQSTLDVTYLISVLNKESGKQTHYEKNTSVTNESQVDDFVASVKAELLDENNTLILDNVTVSRSLQGAMVIMDHNNGQIKALVGGRGEKPGDSVFNRATQGLRQQGSAMKPLVSYAPAIDTGNYMPGSIVIDEPVTYGSWSPRNYTGTFIGPSTIRKAVRDSMNIVAVKVYTDIGSDTIFKYAEAMGISTLVEEDRGAATALGGLTHGISTLEMTGAYATIANGGTYIKPAYYTVVYDHTGNVLLETTSNTGTRVLKETTAYMLTDMMEDVITGGTGTRAKMSNMFVAGKTGTTNDAKDLTFYAYTPYYTAGIWTGYDMAKSISNQSAHITLWKKVMEQVHKDLPSITSVPKPEGIITLTTCAASGDKPSSICSSDYYGNSTQTDIAASSYSGSQNVCKMHASYSICSASGKTHNSNCPSYTKMNVVLAVSGGSIVNKTSSRMSINLGATCNSNHANVSSPSTSNSDSSDSEEDEDFLDSLFDGLIDTSGSSDDSDSSTDSSESDSTTNDSNTTTDDSNDYYQGPVGFGDDTTTTTPSTPSTGTTTTTPPADSTTTTPPADSTTTTTPSTGTTTTTPPADSTTTTLPADSTTTTTPSTGTTTTTPPADSTTTTTPPATDYDIVVPDAVGTTTPSTSTTTPPADTTTTTPSTSTDDVDLVIPDGFFDGNFGIN